MGRERFAGISIGIVDSDDAVLNGCILRGDAVTEENGVGTFHPRGSLQGCDQIEERSAAAGTLGEKKSNIILAILIEVTDRFVAKIAGGDLARRPR